MLPLPDQRWLKIQLRYDPATGIVVWRLGKCAGLNAGFKNKHGMRIEIDGITYLLSRVIWKWMTSNDPTHTIDHIDCNPFNNAWNNLREATRKQQTYNVHRKRHSKSPLKGAFLYPNGTYRSSIRVNGKQVHLGYFATAQEAHDAYVQASKQHHGQYHRAG